LAGLVEVLGASGVFRMLNGPFLDLERLQIFCCCVAEKTFIAFARGSRVCVMNLVEIAELCFAFAKVWTRWSSRSRHGPRVRVVSASVSYSFASGPRICERGNLAIRILCIAFALVVSHSRRRTRLGRI